jgi:hypothetical protein
MATYAAWLIPFLALALAAPSGSDEVAETTELSVSDRDRMYEDRIAELERTVQVLADEIERTRADVTVPEEPELKSSYGLGPAASKVYSVTRGLSIGGYGEAFYRAYVGDKKDEENFADFLRAVLYVGYKFTDRIVWNSEIEIEHADEIFLEFGTLDFLWKDWANVKAGLMLLPIGWLNEIHEPTFFFGVNRPDVERFIIPSTWRENGVGLFGNFGEDVRYKLYAVNGLDATGFSPAGLRGGRQKGSKALAESIAVTGRLDWSPLYGLDLGASIYAGNSGQNQEIEDVKIPDSFTTLFDLHAQVQWRDLWLRGLFTMAFVSQAGLLTENLQELSVLGSDEAIASSMMGGYGEIAYDVWKWIGEGDRVLEPFYRFEWYDTQYDMPDGFMSDDFFEVFSHTVGFSFKPIPNVVLKADYRNRDARKGKIADEFNLGFGYIF